MTSKFVRTQRFMESKSYKSFKQNQKRYTEKVTDLQETFEKNMIENENAFSRDVHKIFEADLNSKVKLYEEMEKNVLQEIKQEKDPLKKQELERLHIQVQAVMDFKLLLKNIDVDKYSTYEETYIQARTKLGSGESKFIDPANIRKYMIEQFKKDKAIQEEDIDLFLTVFYGFILENNTDDYFYFIYQMIFNLLFELENKEDLQFNTVLRKQIKDIIKYYKEEK